VDFVVDFVGVAAPWRGIHRLHGLVSNGYANVAVALKHPRIDMADQASNSLFRDTTLFEQKEPSGFVPSLTRPLSTIEKPNIDVGYSPP
jgi:hypothetical protein